MEYINEFHKEWDRTHSPINSILEQASYIVRRKKETTGTLEPPESYKRGQTKELIGFANSNVSIQQPPYFPL